MNVIPDTVEVGGTLRALSEQHFLYLVERTTEVGHTAAVVLMASKATMPGTQLGHAGISLMTMCQCFALSSK